jgi:hypothetical protein
MLTYTPASRRSFLDCQRTSRMKMSTANTLSTLTTSMLLNVASNLPFLVNPPSCQVPWPSSKHHASFPRFSKKSTQRRRPTTCR